jgi:hypothetical protein
MISPVNGSHAPLSCRWILFRTRSDSVRANNGIRALCLRISDVPRVVTEEDCQGCRSWEPCDTRET